MAVVEVGKDDAKRPKKKRPPPGVGDPIKDGGKGAEEMVQAIAAEQGAEGLQKWMDKFGMGGEVRRCRELREPRAPRPSRDHT